MRLSLANLYLVVNAIFNKAFQAVPLTYQKFTMTVPSSQAAEVYAWLAAIPGMREWIGDRVIHQLAGHDYTIKNKDFELTVSVARNAIEDDNVGVYSPMFEMLGYEAAVFPEVLSYETLANGFTTKCYDGQYFFDTDHPVYDDADTTFSNMQSGSEPAWFLLCTNRPIKPIIWQNRKPAKLVALDKDTDQNVFMRKEFLYGSDLRGNCGYGLPHMAYGSKAELNPENYRLAREAIRGMKSSSGKPLGLEPNLLIVPSTLEASAKIILDSLEISGSTNIWYKTSELIVASRLG